MKETSERRSIYAIFLLVFLILFFSWNIVPAVLAATGDLLETASLQEHLEASSVIVRTSVVRQQEYVLMGLQRVNDIFYIAFGL